MWKNHIKMAIRGLINNRLFTLINVLGLTIGMAATLLIFVWVQNELSFDAFYSETAKINRIYCAWNGGGSKINIYAIPIRLKEEAEKQIPEIEEFYLMRPVFSRPDISTTAGDIFRERSLAYISENWLETFDYDPLAGSIADFEADRYSIALTESYAKKYFGDRNPIGQQLTMDSTAFTVKLIVKDRPANSSFYFQMYLPLETYWKNEAAYERDYDSGNYNYLAFFKADQAVDREAVATKLATILNSNMEQSTNSCTVAPIASMRFNQDFTYDYFPHQKKSTVYIFALIGFLFLLIAGLNYVNLSTALLSKNVKEIGVKKVIGADFKHIFSQVLAETTVISLLSFVFAIGIVYLALPYLSDFIEFDLSFDPRKPAILFSLLGLLTLSVLIAGVYPAMISAGAKPIQLLGGKRQHTKDSNLRQVLVITQFTASVVILISTFVIYQQLQFIQKKDVGYDRSKVVLIEPRLWRGEGSADNFRKFRTYKKELEQLAGFESVAMTDAAIENISNQNSGSLSWEGKPEDLVPNVTQMRANEELQEVFDLKMAAGRWFEEERSNDLNNIIINEAAVQTFNIPEPVIGRKASFQGRDGEIVGVVKNFNFGSLRDAISPLVIWNIGQGGNKIMARINSDDTETTIAQAKTIFDEMIPNVEFEYSFIEDNFIQLHEADNRMSILFQIFAGLLIFISCLGLLGLAVFAAERRVKEIGIRKVLGASVLNLIGLLSKDFLKLVLIALVLAIPIAFYAMNQWLSDFAYRIDIQWWVFALAGMAAIGIALLTVSFQSIKAALANPVNSLRNE